jgi:hypothetical protein
MSVRRVRCVYVCKKDEGCVYVCMKDEGGVCL